MNTHNTPPESHEGTNEEQQGLPPQQEERLLADTSMEQSAIDPREAQTISVDWKYDFVTADLDTPAFFAVRLRDGKNKILINTNHPAYDYLAEMLECDETSPVDVNGLQERLDRAYNALKLLFTAWALYEDDQVGKPQRLTQQARTDWGIFARRFLEREK